MKSLWRQKKQAEGLVRYPAAADLDNRHSPGLVTRAEKSFTEMFLLVFSVMLHLSHSLERGHDAGL